jgi:hypothetical protein
LVKDMPPVTGLKIAVGEEFETMVGSAMTDVGIGFGHRLSSSFGLDNLQPAPLCPL